MARSKTPNTPAKDQSAPDPAGAPMAMPPGGWPTDEFSGQAGRFVRDPATGVRRRAEEPQTEQPPPAA